MMVGIRTSTGGRDRKGEGRERKGTEAEMER